MIEWRQAAFAVIAFGLAGCGGGGGGGDGGGDGRIFSLIQGLSTGDTVTLQGAGLAVSGDAGELYDSATVKRISKEELQVTFKSSAGDPTIKATFDLDDAEAYGKTGIVLNFAGVETGTLAMVSIDGTSSLALDHMAFGYWAVFDPTLHLVGALGGALGDPSPDVATISGLTRGTYKGKTVGIVSASDVGADSFFGDATLTADFTAGQIDAAFTNLNIGDDNGNPVPSGVLPDVRFTDIALSGSGFGSVDPTQAQFGGVTPNGAGAIAGTFYGPAAEEVGGTWYVQHTALGVTAQMGGAFGAAR